jgi:flagellar biosynthetic protein FliR
MTVNIDPAWVMATFLTAVRIGTLLIMSPILSGLGSLVVVRVLLTLSLSAMLVSGMQLPVTPVPMQFGSVVFAAMAEVLTGAVLAFGVFAAFGAFSVAGKILDIQSGFGIGSVYDPVTRSGAPLFATMLNMVAVVVFFSVDAHHAFMRGIAFSLSEVPVGSGFLALDADAVIRQFGLMFLLGVALIIPVLLCMLLVEVGLAVISRVLPQMNVFVVVVPAKIFAGVALFALTVTTMSPSLQKVFGTIFLFWEQAAR